MCKLKHFLVCLFVVIGTANVFAGKVDIPTTANIDLNNATLTNCNIENGGRDVGSTHKGSVIKLELNNTTEQAYLLSLLTGASNLTADYEVKVVNAANEEVMSTTMHIMNTGAWTPSLQQKIYIPTIAVGTYTLTLTCTSTTASYAGNLGSVKIEACNYDVMPGILDLQKGIYTGMRYETGNQNIGYVSDGTTATYNFYCDKDAYYRFYLDVTKYGAGTIDFEITDYTTHETVTKSVAVPQVDNYTTAQLLEAIHLSKGVMSMKMTVHTGNSFAMNYRKPEWVFQAEKVASVSKMKVNGNNAEAGEDTDWVTYLAKSFNEANTTISFTLLDGTVAVTAKDENDADVTVTDKGNNTYSIPTPAQGASTIISIVLTPNSDAVVLQTNYTVKINHLGDILVKELYVDGIKIGEDIVTAINTADAYTATFANVFTQIPTVSALINDGKTVNGTVAHDGIKAVYALKAGSDDETRTFTLNVEEIHIYNKGANDKSHSIAPGTGFMDGNIWSDGQVTLNGGGDWAFKLRSGEYTLTFPQNWKVKQVKFGNSADNYASTGYIASASSEGATVYVPFDTRLIQGKERDFYVNIDNHVAGTPFNFTLVGASQATFRTIEIVYEEQAVDVAPTLNSYKVSDTTGKNHAVVAMTFSHAVAEAVAECDGKDIKARGTGSTTLYFSTWDLDYDKDYILTIPAGKLTDAYGNKNTEAISVTFTTGSKVEVDLSKHDYEVSTVDELRNAVEAANSSSATRKVIFIKNGDYDMESNELTINGKNIYLIGESREGVLIHGNRSDISYPVICTRYGSDIYFENMTIRNDKNWRAADKNGVGVALRTGTRTICYHVNLQSNQDTYVSMGDGLFLECEINGTVDFICGGGNVFFDKCDIVIENRGGNVIVAPSTDAATEWGYVFSNCTVRPAEDASQEDIANNLNKHFDLGRPWQNVPRAAFLNTTFNILPTDASWRNMSANLETHFYEYGSMDAQGNILDLSTRNVEKCNSSNGNYTPVLSAEEAAEFTMYNVLGGNDSWNPKDAFDNTDTTTGINNVVQESTLNVQGALYNLAGQKVDAGYKGIVIKNGKKYFNQ